LIANNKNKSKIYLSNNLSYVKLINQYTMQNIPIYNPNQLIPHTFGHGIVKTIRKMQLYFHSIKLIDGFRVNYVNDVPLLTMSADDDLMRTLAWKQ
jgi:hypothetical protein